MALSKLMAARLLLGAVATLGAGQTAAQDSAALYQRATAATCANCHGTDGRSVSGSAVVSLAGMPKAIMVAQMKAFQDGSRPATVMHQLAKGLTAQQIDSIADYFAAQKR